MWGCYAAIKGRRMSLLVALFLHGISELLASVVPFYWVFLFLKFLSGCCYEWTIGRRFLYLGEFQPTKYRDKMLSWMEMAWVVGMIILAGVGWIIIPLNVNIETDSGFFFPFVESFRVHMLPSSLVDRNLVAVFP